MRVQAVASHAHVLRASSRVPPPRVSGTGTRDEPLRTSAGAAIQSMAILLLRSCTFTFVL